MFFEILMGIDDKIINKKEGEKRETKRSLDDAKISAKAIKNIQREFKVDFKVKGQKVTKLYLETENGKVQVDLYATSKQTFGLNKIIRTDSAEHNIWVANMPFLRVFG